MKLLFYQPNVYRFATGEGLIGGAARQIWLLGRNLAERGHEIHVLSPYAEKICQIQGLTFHHCSPGNPVRFMRRCFARIQPDWFYWRANSYVIGPLFYLARKAGIRTLFAVAFDTDCIPVRALTERPFLWPLYSYGLHLADRLIIQHRGQAEMLPAGLRPKVRLVNSMVDQVRTASPAIPPFFAWVGALREPKRPHLLPQIAAMCPEVAFRVCGPITRHRTRKGYGEAVVKAFEKTANIDYLGEISAANAHALIESATALVSTAYREGFPNTFLQAWSTGVPVLSLQLDPGGVIGEHGIGLVCSDINQLARTITTLRDTPSMRQVMGDAGAAYVTSHHTSDFVISQFERALSESERE